MKFLVRAASWLLLLLALEVLAQTPAEAEPTSTVEPPKLWSYDEVAPLYTIIEVATASIENPYVAAAVYTELAGAHADRGNASQVEMLALKVAEIVDESGAYNLTDIARHQAAAGDTAGIRKTSALIANDFDLRSVAKLQVHTGDLSGALSTLSRMKRKHDFIVVDLISDALKTVPLPDLVGPAMSIENPLSQARALGTVAGEFVCGGSIEKAQELALWIAPVESRPRVYWKYVLSRLIACGKITLLPEVLQTIDDAKSADDVLDDLSIPLAVEYAITGNFEEFQKVLRGKKQEILASIVIDIANRGEVELALQLASDIESEFSRSLALSSIFDVFLERDATQRAYEVLNSMPWDIRRFSGTCQLAYYHLNRGNLHHAERITYMVPAGREYAALHDADPASFVRKGRYLSRYALLQELVKIYIERRQYNKAHELAASQHDALFRKLWAEKIDSHQSYTSQPEVQLALQHRDAAMAYVAAGDYVEAFHAAEAIHVPEDQISFYFDAHYSFLATSVDILEAIPTKDRDIALLQHIQAAIQDFARSTGAEGKSLPIRRLINYTVAHTISAV